MSVGKDIHRCQERLCDFWSYSSGPVLVFEQTLSKRTIECVASIHNLLIMYQAHSGKNKTFAMAWM